MNKIRNSHVETLILDINGIFAADNQHRKLLQPSVLSAFFDNLEPVLLRHLQIQQQRRRFFPVFPQHAQRLFTVSCRIHNIVVFKDCPQQFAVHFRIVHDQYPAPHKNPPFSPLYDDKAILPQTCARYYAFILSLFSG